MKRSVTLFRKGGFLTQKLEISEHITDLKAYPQSDNKAIYYCPKVCPIRKHCFVIKLVKELPEPLTVLKKCPACNGQDIRIVIGISGVAKREEEHE